MAADAAALFGRLEFNKDVLIMGHSIVRVTTFALAVLEPNLVKEIVLVDPPYWDPGPYWDDGTRDLQDAPDIFEATIHIYESLLTADNNPEWLKLWYNRRIIETPEHAILRCIEGLNMNGEGFERAEMHEKFAAGKRKGPRLAVHAEQEKVGKEKGLEMGELDEVIAITEVGHWPHQTKSEEFNEIIGAWLKDVERA